MLVVTVAGIHLVLVLPVTIVKAGIIAGHVPGAMTVRFPGRPGPQVRDQTEVIRTVVLHALRPTIREIQGLTKVAQEVDPAGLVVPVTTIAQTGHDPVASVDHLTVRAPGVIAGHQADQDPAAIAQGRAAGVAIQALAEVQEVAEVHLEEEGTNSHYRKRTKVRP